MVKSENRRKETDMKVKTDLKGYLNFNVSFQILTVVLSKKCFEVFHIGIQGKLAAVMAAMFFRGIKFILGISIKVYLMWIPVKVFQTDN